MNKKVIISILVSGIFLFFTFYTVDFEKLFLALKKINYLYLLPATFFLYLTIFIRSFRWQYLLNPLKKVSFSSLFSAMSIGLMANAVLPARIGEIIFAVVVGEKEKVSKTSAFATVVVSRIFDGVTLLLMFVLLILIYPFDDPILQTLAYLASAIYGLAILVVLGLYLAQNKVIHFIKTAFKFIPEKILQKIILALEAFVEGLHFLKDFKSLIVVTLLSVVTWIIAAFSYLPIIYAFSFDESLPIYAPFFLLTIVALGVMLPSAPGFVGVFHFASTLAISLMNSNIDKDSSAAFAIVLHASQLLPIILIGFIFLWKEGMSLTRLKKQKVEV